MAFREVKSKSYRSKIQAVQMKEKFADATKSVKVYGRISPAEFGIDWNKCALDKFTTSKGLEYTLGGYNGCSRMEYEGYIKDKGADNLLIKIDRNANGQAFHDNYVVESLYDAVNIASKLEIIGDEILPSGDIGLREITKSPPKSVSKSSNVLDIEECRAFAAELVDKSRGIIVSKINNDFGDYVVLETNKDFYIAYNTGYGEAPYIVDQFENLLQDKQTLKKSGEAIWFRRDPRGNWKDRIREFV